MRRQKAQQKRAFTHANKVAARVDPDAQRARANIF